MKRASVVAIKNEFHEYLLLKRSPDGFMPNLWSLPGGKLDYINTEIIKGKGRSESYEEAAYRELKEETGIKANILIHLKGMTFFGTDHIVKVYYCPKYQITQEVKFPNREHVEMRWISLSDMKLLEVGNLTKMMIKIVDRIFDTTLDNISIKTIENLLKDV